MGEQSAACLIQGYETSALHLLPTELPFELILLNTLEIVISRGDLLNSYTVKSPSCLKKCKSINSCSANASNIAMNSTILRELFSFSDDIYGEECALVLEEKKEELLMSRMLKRIAEEFILLRCLVLRFKKLKIKSFSLFFLFF